MLLILWLMRFMAGFFDLLRGCFVVGLTMRHDYHDHDHDDHVHPNSKVGNPAKFLQSPDLAKEHAQDRPDYAAYDVADVPVDLIEALTMSNDDHPD